MVFIGQIHPSAIPLPYLSVILLRSRPSAAIRSGFSTLIKMYSSQETPRDQTNSETIGRL